MRLTDWGFHCPDASVPGPLLKKVMKFAYTDYPDEQYAMNHYVMPFACHGQDYNFWEPIICKHRFDW